MLHSEICIKSAYANTMECGIPIPDTLKLFGTREQASFFAPGHIVGFAHVTLKNACRLLYKSVIPRCYIFFYFI